MQCKSLQITRVLANQKWARPVKYSAIFGPKETYPKQFYFCRYNPHELHELCVEFPVHEVEQLMRINYVCDGTTNNGVYQAIAGNLLKHSQ